MIDISPELTAAFNATSKTYYSKVKLNFSDLTIDPSMEVSTTEDFPKYLVDQITNGRTTPKRKWACLDGIGGTTIDNWVDSSGNNMTDSSGNNMTAVTQAINTDLSGNYYLVPGSEKAALATQVGLWSNSITDNDGVCNVSYEVIGTKRNLSDVYIYGDDKRVEYPVDLTVTFYDGITVLDTKVVTANASTEIHLNLSPQINNVTKFVVNITKWSKAKTPVKIVSTLTGLNQEFLDSEIIQWSVQEESEINNNATIPTGNISSSAFNLDLINVNRQFDVNNTTSPLHNNLKPNAKIDAWLGALTANGIEYVKVFSGWTEGFDAPDNSLNVNTVGYDRLKRLGLTSMNPKPVYLNQTASYLIRMILNDADISDEYIDIDPRLDATEYIIDVFWISAGTHLDELKRISAAVSGSVFTRDDIIVFDAIGQRTEFSIAQEFTRSDYSNKTNRPIYDTIYNKIQAPYTAYSSCISESQYKSASTLDSIALGATQETFLFKNKTCYNHTKTFTPPAGITIISENYYSDRAEIVFNNTNTSPILIDIEFFAEYYCPENKKTANVKDNDSINNYGEFAFQFNDSELVQTSVMADTIANLTLSSYKDPFRDAVMTLQMTGNPAVTLQDNITITDMYTSETYNIVSRNIRYDGGLSMTYKCKKSVLAQSNWVDSSGNNMIDSNGNNMIILGVRN